MTGRTYQCKDCGVKVTIGVPVKTPPVHPCPRHVNKIKELQEVETRDSKRRQSTSE